MSNPDIVRAWKDERYRASLSSEELALVPAHPAGLIELADADLEGMAGGQLPATYATACSEGWRCLSVSKC